MNRALSDAELEGVSGGRDSTAMPDYTDGKYRYQNYCCKCGRATSISFKPNTRTCCEECAKRKGNWLQNLFK